MAHHENDGTASGILRGLLREHGYNNNPGALLTAAAILAARCAEGDHDETVAEEKRVTWLGMGVRVEPGTRYCCRCKTILELP